MRSARRWVRKTSTAVAIALAAATCGGASGKSLADAASGNWHCEIRGGGAHVAKSADIVVSKDGTFKLVVGGKTGRGTWEVSGGEVRVQIAGSEYRYRGVKATGNFDAKALEPSRDHGPGYPSPGFMVSGTFKVSVNGSTVRISQTGWFGHPVPNSDMPPPLEFTCTR